MGRPSKVEKLKKLNAPRDEEEIRIKNLLKQANLYTPSLDPLIENYLDAFVVYKTMFDAWRDEGFPPTKLHENKAGAINEMKHPLAQQVETWHERKNKMYKLLGMTNDGKSVQKQDENDNKPSGNSPQDELAAHRAKWGGTR